MKPKPWGTLVILLLGHAALSLLFNFLTPVFEGPDEPNHYLFGRYLQLEHTLPIQGAVRDAVRAHHPPGYFALDALLTALVPAPASVTADFASLGLRTNPRYDFRFDDPNPDNKSVFLHFGPGELWPYAGLALTVHVGRLLSLAFTLLAIGLTFVAARQLRPADTRFAALAAGLIAFNPMVLFMSGVIQNDASALAAGAAVLAALGWLLARGPNARRWLAVGAIYAAGILLKAGLLALAAPIGLVALYTAWRMGVQMNALGRGVQPTRDLAYAKSRRGQVLNAPTLVGEFARTATVAGLGLALPVLALDGWWFVRNQMLYGDWTANASIVALWGPLSAEAQRQFLPLALYSLATGMLGRFGNGGIIDFPFAVYVAGGLLLLAGLAGAIRLALRRDTAAPSHDFGSGPAAILWLAHAATIVTVTVSVVIFALEFNGGATGKYLFPMFPSLALLLAAGWLGWFPARWRTVAVVVLVGLSAAASIYAAFGLLQPAFGPPRQPLPGELNSATALEADLGGDARLLAYRLDRPTVRPGETLQVTVYWLPEAATTAPYTVFVHLTDPTLGTLAQRDIYPGGGTYPTTVWQAGRVFVDTYSLKLPADAPRSDNAQLVIGLYDETNGQRLTATGGDAGPPGTDWIQIGRVAVKP